MGSLRHSVQRGEESFFVVTMWFNVPRNNKLARLNPTRAESITVWREDLITWTAWNPCAHHSLARSGVFLYRQRMGSPVRRGGHTRRSSDCPRVRSRVAPKQFTQAREDSAKNAFYTFMSR